MTAASITATDMTKRTSTDASPTGETPGAGQFLYAAVAGEVAQQIRDGARPPGSRLPSLRQSADERQLSVATILAAYQELAALGLIEARPKAGYFVCHKTGREPALPSRTQPAARSVAVSVSKPSLALLENASRPDMAPLGCAIPAPEMLETVRIDRMLSRINRSAGGTFNTYSPPLGAPDLRGQIARRHLAFGDHADPDEIVVTNGCTEALYLALGAVAKTGDTVAVESPTYFGILQIIESLGLKVLELPTDHQGISLEALADGMCRRRIAACLFSSSYSNPLGATMPDERKMALLKLLAEHGVPLIEDDIYGDLCLRGKRPRPYVSFASAAEVFYCSSFSKALAPGYRVGWLRCRTRFDSIADRKFATSLCNAMLPQVTIARYLETGAYERHLRRLLPALRRNVDRMRHEIAARFPLGTGISDPAGGFVLWLELDRTFDSTVLFEEALKKHICFAPGTIFSATGIYRHCLRISCGHPWDRTLERSLRVLGALALDVSRRR